MPPVAIECVSNMWREALAGTQELQSDVQGLDSRLVDAEQDPGPNSESDDVSDSV